MQKTLKCSKKCFNSQDGWEKTIYQGISAEGYWQNTELSRYILQISLKYIKLVIPKILFILVLCSFFLLWEYWVNCQTRGILKLQQAICNIDSRLVIIQNEFKHSYVMLWCIGYHYRTTSFNKAQTGFLPRFNSCLWCVGNSRW